MVELEYIFEREGQGIMDDFIASNAKPFVKWVGGKSQLLSEIRANYPDGLGDKINKYAEPFIGGGAVLFDILNNYKVDEVYISDINYELICTYIAIRDNVNELVAILLEMEQVYLSASTDERKIIYYDNRDRFNEIKAITNNKIAIAALFVFLNKTCFNGLYRVNRKGGFNVPQGEYKNPCICDTENLRAVSKKLANVKIVCGDYKLSADFVDDNTFVYFDPPYRPLTETSSFTSYSKDGFNDDSQVELAKYIDLLAKRGAYTLVSNSDPKNADENDTFFDKLYSNHRILRIQANRAINSNGTKRGKINELLIANL